MWPSSVRSPLYALCAVGGLALAWGWPASASAWADATVRTARARVTLSPDASTVHVVLVAELRVDGGWLEGFELDGLDDGLTLDPSAPPVFERWAIPEEPLVALPENGSPENGAVPDLDAEGPALETRDAAPRPAVFVDTLSPRVSVHGSRVAMSFPRRSAPRAGLYRARVTYDAPAEARIVRTPEHAELSWTLPAWRFGLDGVEVVLVLPEGASTPPLEEDEAAAIELGEGELAEDEAGVALRYTRVHLPRTQAWTVRAELPPSFRAPAEPERPLSAAEPEAAPPAESAQPLVLAVLALILAVLVVAKSRARELEAGQADAGTGALLQLPGKVRVALVLALLLASWVLSFTPEHLPWALAAMALLGTHGRGRPLEAARLGSFRSAWGSSAASVRAAQRSLRSSRSPFDATGIGGAALLVVLVSGLALAFAYGLLSLDAAAVSGAAFVLVLVSGGGRSRPRSALQSLGLLLRWAERLEVDLEQSLALAPLVHVDIKGRLQAARLRVVLSAPEDGLLRSDLVLGEDGRPTLLLAARSKSAAEKTLLDLAARRQLEITGTDADRTALAWPDFDLEELARAFRRATPAETTLAAAS